MRSQTLSRSFTPSPSTYSFFPPSLPILHAFKTNPSTSPSLPKSPLSCIRNCTSITAKPSSQFSKTRTEPEPDNKLRALRQLFSKPGIGIDAYIIPSQDAHQSEFIAECYMRRAYISGFTGSAGTAIVTKDKAALWTDGRYFLQAEKQLNSSWILMRAGNLGVPTISEWLCDVLVPGCNVGIDPFLFSSDAAEELKEAIAKRNLDLVYLYDLNLVDEIWKESRPKPPNKPIRVHDLRYAGLDVASKLSSLQAELADAGSSAIVISMLDEVSWLLNLRGGDVPHSPVVYAYLIVEIDGAKLFVDNSKVTPEVMDHLKKAGVELMPYNSILFKIKSLAAQGAQLWLDAASVNAAIVETYKSACDIYSGNTKNKSKSNARTCDTSAGQSGGPGGPTAIYRPSPISLAKAVKNSAELEGMQSSHLRDAAALAQFWVWLEEEIHKDVKLTEVDVADKLLAFRSMQAGFIDTSFETISGSGANGAVIHYKPEPGSCSVVDPEKLFLLDSGAQYVDGTTDITRTVHFGEPTAREKECFTRVLQGHIALDQAVFPENTPGFVLDVLARSSLWKIGLDYRHGTGHGVGAALNVHEGPQSISYRYGNLTPLQKGMIVSNEPGYYEDHAFGIRIENLLWVKEVDTPNRFGGIGYLGFEKLTFVPIQTKLVNVSLLSVAEIDWLNEYHSQVWEKVSPLLNGSAREWLWNNTRPPLVKL
ncbi:Peptidase_M24 domain-containing protein/Creatinase_N domain-containing protein [Cephalotus follicularis]|uniref:Peptidase_M24 domain-containing protein/Creatinase_N domain-containing protein n=1 Tax=Cephalotus follicularis TaxID=3775 RepID=A0A1Q3B587_CEPFO|nr:Peptidase_M24 domain-containing protein/Creatinase_N domain-containing protein [Cephalotus follicularis]